MSHPPGCDFRAAETERRTRFVLAAVPLEAFLHADFDRDSTLSQQAAEYGLRLTRPAAIVLPNLDLDLSGRASPGADLVSLRDLHQLTKNYPDNDLAEFRIELRPPPAATPAIRSDLRVHPADARRVRIYGRGPASASGGGPAASGVGTGATSPLAGFLAGNASAHPEAGAHLEIFGRLPDAAGVYPCDLEVLTLIGSPYETPVGPPPRSPHHSGGTPPPRSMPASRRPHEIWLEVCWRDLQDHEVGRDVAIFSVTPVILMSNLCAPEVLYLADLPGNQEAVADVRDALARMGQGASPLSVSLVLASQDLANNDGWLQDQFQIGYCWAPQGWEHVVLHFRRLRSNVTQSMEAPNLANFVRAHFLGTPNVGLFEDLWTQTRPEEQARPFDAGAEYGRYLRVLKYYKFLERIVLHLQQASRILAPLGSEAVTATRPVLEQGSRRYEDLLLAFRGLRDECETRSRQPRSDAGSSPQASLVSDVNRQLDLDERALTRTRILAQEGSQGPDVVEPTREEVALYERELRTAFDSTNWGGNIVASPPVADAPYGKIFVGSRADRLAHVDTLRLLREQQVQPVVTLDTHWLEVAHADELISFVPAPAQAGGRWSHRVIRASPEIGLRILRAAQARHLRSRPAGYVDREARGLTMTRAEFAAEYQRGHEAERERLWRWQGTEQYRREVPLGLPSDPSEDRLMRAGREAVLEFGELDNRASAVSSCPLTRLFRGKSWMLIWPTGAAEPLLPSHVYRWLVEHYRFGGEGVLGAIFPYRNGAGSDEHYAAAISVTKVLHLCAEPNERIVREHLTALDRDLVAALPGLRESAIIGLPVLFDAVRDFPPDTPVSALTPDLVNLQVLGSHVLVPRPFGPRMRTDDAAAVLSEVLGRTIAPGSIRGLEGFRFRFAAGGFPNVFGIADLFHDGFRWSDSHGSGTPFNFDTHRQTVADLIHDANRPAGAIAGDGTIQATATELRIPEPTVDLFEAYTQIVLGELGLEIHWIDGWFYHVRKGEIHCGTNVKRRPYETEAGFTQRWWDLPAFRDEAAAR